jgi:hypothetical protein
MQNLLLHVRTATGPSIWKVGILLSCALLFTSHAHGRVSTNPTITISNLTHVWNGEEKVPTITTDPVGRAVAVTYNGSSLAPRDVGEYTVVANFQNSFSKGNASNPLNFVVGTAADVQAASDSVTGNNNVTATLRIIKAEQTVSITDPGEIALNTPTAITATSSVDLPVTLHVVSGPASLDGKVISITAAEPAVVIEARQAGNDNYNTASAQLTLGIDATSINRIANLSTRPPTFMDANQEMVLGLVIGGTADKPILFRAVGPSLANYQVSNFMSDPEIEIYDGSGQSIALNDDWGNDTSVTALSATVGAFPLDASSADAALLLTLSPGVYTAHVRGGTGQVIAEIYDGDPAPTLANRLLNTSSRGFVSPGNPLISGLVVAGNASESVLIRGVGPGLVNYLVPGPLNNPTLTVFDASGNVVARNESWENPLGSGAATGAQLAAAASTVGAFALPAGGQDAALLLTLSPGVYTVHLSPADNGSGEALLEIYDYLVP